MAGDFLAIPAGVPWLPVQGRRRHPRHCNGSMALEVVVNENDDGPQAVQVLGPVGIHRR